MFYEFAVPVLASAILVSICLSGCSISTGPEVREEFHGTYEVGAGTKIEVYNKNGTVRMSQWGKDSVDVHAIKKTRRGEAELEKVRIEVSTAGEMVVETKYVKKDARVSVDYEIKIPASVLVGHVDNSNGSIEIEGTKGDATATTSNGKIIVRNVDGWISATTSNGKIQITGTTGILKAETSNGSIEAEISNVKDHADITTSNGSIKLWIFPELNADVEMRTSNGKLAIHDLEVAISESSSKYVKGKIGNGGGRIDVGTSNGNVDLYRRNGEKK